MIFLFSGRFVLAADVKYDKTILLFQDKIRKIEAKRIELLDSSDPDLVEGKKFADANPEIKELFSDLLGSLPDCYDLFVNGKKVKVLDKQHDYNTHKIYQDAFCFDADNIKFYSTDKSGWFVFSSNVKKKTDVSTMFVLFKSWIFLNFNKAGFVDPGIALTESYGKNGAIVRSCASTSDISFRHTSLMAKNLKIPLSGGVSDVVDKGDCHKYFNSMYLYKTDSPKIDKQPKLLGFNLGYGKDDKFAPSSNGYSPSYEYSEKVSKQIMCSKEDEMDYSSHLCGTQKKVMGISHDMTKLYFTADADYLDGVKIKNWKENYTFDLKNDKIVKEKIGKTIKIKFVKDLK